MHTRVGPRVDSREIRLTEAIPIVPIVFVILVLAFYPQFLLKRSEPSVQTHTELVSSGDPP
jgi:NADH:ubiquinone oxidoreductase subunit 4 (subunit M)